MQPKTIKILYWVFTILFVALMIFSSWASIVVNKDAVDLINGFLGYPVYIIPFTGWAKVIGCIVILIPGLKTIKEWAYAGLFFDLVAATYSIIAASKGNVDPATGGMLIWFAMGILSYVYWKKMLRVEGQVRR